MFYDILLEVYWAGQGLYFKNVKLPWDGSCLLPAQRSRAASANTTVQFMWQGQGERLG